MLMHRMRTVRFPLTADPPSSGTFGRWLAIVGAVALLTACSRSEQPPASAATPSPNDLSAGARPMDAETQAAQKRQALGRLSSAVTHQDSAAASNVTTP